MSKSKLLRYHFFTFLALTIILFFSAESILKIFLPGFHDVIIWISLIVLGIGILFTLSLVSLIIFFLFRKKT